MIRLLTAVLSLWVALVPLALVPLAAHADGDGSPHHMTKADGSLDPTACGMCHNEDFTLQRSKLETCTLCHAQTVHAGSDEHLRANPAAVKQAFGDAAGAPALPLADDGHIYCGTCHLFHDPKVASEDWLKHGWLPADRGLAAAVRQGVADRWAALAAATVSGDKSAGPSASSSLSDLAVPSDQRERAIEMTPTAGPSPEHPSPQRPNGERPIEEMPTAGAVGKFAAKGTLQMRLPVDDGQLCRRCHGAPR